MKTGSPDQEEASSIDNQDPLKAWILFLTKKTNNARKNNKEKKKQSEIGLLTSKTQTGFQKTP
jgi:hypothetical protein